MPRVVMPVIADVRAGGTRYFVDNLELAFSAASNPVPTAEGSLVISDATLEYAELLHPGAAYYHLETDATTADWQANLTLPDNAHVGLPGPGGRLVFNLTPAPDQVVLTDANLNLNGNDFLMPDNTADAFKWLDDGATEYMRLVTLNAQPIIDFNAGGADVDFHVRANGVANALQVRGIDGQITLGALGTGLVKSTAGVLSIAIATDLPAHAAEHEIGGGDLVNHDNLTNFVANEHIDHTAVTLTAGAGLTGGGTIAANRTFDVTSTSDGETNPSTILAADANGRLRLKGLGIDTPVNANYGVLAITAGLFAAIEGRESSGVGVSGTSSSGFGGVFVSTSHYGVFGETAAGATKRGVWGNGVNAGGGVFGSANTGIGGEFASATGIGLVADLTGAGTAIAEFRDNGTPVLTVRDGGQADFAEYLRHLGDTDTWMRFQDNQWMLSCGGVTFVDADEAAGPAITLGGDGVIVPDNFTIGLGLAAGTGRIEFDNQATDEINFLNCRVGIGTFSPSAILDAKEANDGGNTTLLLENSAAAGSTDEITRIWFKHANQSAAIINVGRESDYSSEANQDAYMAFVTYLNGAGSEQMRITSTGNVGIATTAPGQIFDVNSGSGNMIADGYDTHSLAEYKENIEVIDNGLIDKLKLFNLYKWTRVPFVSTEELVALAIIEFELENVDDARGYYADLAADDPIRLWIDAKRDELREKRRELPKYQRRHTGLVADDPATLDAIPNVISRDEDDGIIGYSLSNHVGFLHGVIRELVDRIEVLEGT